MNVEYFLDYFSSDEEAEEIDTFSSDFDSSEEGLVLGGVKQTIESYSNLDFKTLFRINRSTVLDLIEKYKLTELSAAIGHPKLDPDLEMYMFLWYISNTIRFRELANIFGVAKSTLCNVIERVSGFFVDNGGEYLKWPSQEDAKIISNKFEQIKKIPNIIGIIDGTHIKIKAPLEYPSYYYNRNKIFSISMQVVVDSNKNFIDVYCGEPGSYNDGMVLRRSTLYKDIEDNSTRYFQTNQFILGDSAYPAKEWLVPPFKDSGTLTDGQHEFNKIHSSMLELVRDAIRLLKTRFRRLQHFTEHIDLKLLTKIVYSACVLHNICLSQNDAFEVDVLVPEAELDTMKEILPATAEMESRRERLYMELIQKNIL